METFISDMVIGGFRLGLLIFLPVLLGLFAVRIIIKLS